MQNVAKPLQNESKINENYLKIDEKTHQPKHAQKNRNPKGTTQENFEKTYDAQKLDVHNTL